MTEVLAKYPKELTEGREYVEMTFVMSLWKDPDLYGDYGSEINIQKDLFLMDSIFYFKLGKEMYDLGARSFDDVTIASHVAKNEVYLDGINRRGGIKEIDKIRAVINAENIEAYYDKLIKTNTLMRLHDKGFDVLTDIKKFDKMTTSQVYDYFEYHLDNVFLSRGSGIKVEDLTISDNMLNDANDGLALGLNYGNRAKLLNYHTMGIHKANVQVFAGYSGTGKSSFAVYVYLLSILDGGEKLTIIANEMALVAWQQLILITVIADKFGYRGIDRKQFKSGNFTDEQWEYLRKGQNYINTVYKGRLKFVKIFDYSINDVKRITRKMAKQGFTYVLYDTFKAENSASDKMTGELIEASKQLLQVAEKENIGIIITMQLAIHTEGTRYLTAQTLSGAKGVKEVVSELVLMRNLWEDEYDKCQYDVKPFEYVMDIHGNYTKTKREIVLNPETKYKIVFLDKTRNDEGDLCVLFEFDGAFNIWKEIGYCTPVRVRQQAPNMQRG